MKRPLFVVGSGSAETSVPADTLPDTTIVLVSLKPMKHLARKGVIHVDPSVLLQEIDGLEGPQRALDQLIDDWHLDPSGKPFFDWRGTAIGRVVHARLLPIFAAYQRAEFLVDRLLETYKDPDWILCFQPTPKTWLRFDCLPFFIQRTLESRGIPFQIFPASDQSLGISGLDCTDDTPHGFLGLRSWAIKTAVAWIKRKLSGSQQPGVLVSPCRIHQEGITQASKSVPSFQLSNWMTLSEIWKAPNHLAPVVIAPRPLAAWRYRRSTDQIKQNLLLAMGDFILPRLCPSLRSDFPEIIDSIFLKELHSVLDIFEQCRDRITDGRWTSLWVKDLTSELSITLALAFKSCQKRVLHSHHGYNARISYSTGNCKRSDLATDVVSFGTPYTSALTCLGFAKSDIHLIPIHTKHTQFKTKEFNPPTTVLIIDALPASFQINCDWSVGIKTAHTIASQLTNILGPTTSFRFRGNPLFAKTFPSYIRYLETVKEACSKFGRFDISSHEPIEQDLAWCQLACGGVSSSMIDAIKQGIPYLALSLQREASFLTHPWASVKLHASRPQDIPDVLKGVLSLGSVREFIQTSFDQAEVLQAYTKTLENLYISKV